MELRILENIIFYIARLNIIEKSYTETKSSSFHFKIIIPSRYIILSAVLIFFMIFRLVGDQDK